MKNTMDKFKNSIDKFKLVSALAGIFLCGVILSMAGTSYWLGQGYQRQLGAYDRQVDRLNTLLVEANTTNRALLDHLVTQTNANSVEIGKLLDTLRTTSKTVTKASKSVQAASETVVEAQAKVEAPKPVAPLPEPPKAIVPWRLPHDEDRIEP